MRILYQFPLSHFCEKARWMLDYKELDYVAQNLTPGVHRAFARLKTGQNRLPILKDHNTFIADSTQIALYLDEHYPEHPLLPIDPNTRKKVIEINEMTLELGRHIRRWVLSQALNDDQESMEILIGEKGYLRQFERFSKPILKAVMTKGYALSQDSVAESKAFIDEMIDRLNDLFVQHHSSYFVGQYLTLADIAVCSMLAPLLAIPSTPWEKEHFEMLSQEFRDYQHLLMQKPIGQYVVKIYQKDRAARVDWRGV